MPSRPSLIDLLLTNPHGWGNEPPRPQQPAYQDDAGNSYGFDGSILDRWRTPQNEPQHNPSLADSLVNIATSPAKLAYGMVAEPYNALARLGDNFVTADGRLGLPNPQNPENQTDMATLLMTGFGSNALRTGRPGMLSSGPIAPKEPPKGITAYHGSPHDFDRFDSSRIGTGEGAQAYGHGLYFAESEGVARSYRDALTEAPSPTIGGRRPDQWVPSEGAAVALRSANHSRAFAIQNAEANLAHDIAAKADRKVITWRKEILKHLNAGTEAKFDPADSTGHIYQVRINAEPEQFLDWDKPLSQQSEVVRNVFSDVPHEISGSEAWDAVMRGYIHDSATPVKGMDAMPLVSRDLAENGIPGIRYLDQMSRGKGEGSYNYVVFDDSLIEILKKYGLAGLMAGGAAATTDQPNALETYRY